MTFKLGSENRENKYGSGKNIFGDDDASVPGVRVIRKDLPEGIDAEANNDGTIFLGQHITPGSTQERKVLMHEMKHMVDLQTGRLKYDDYSVTWDGEAYRRLEGRIKYNGEWLQEGDTRLPWEQH
tara:strand:- start:407 stop:781 length:375 start_codon:yes stop_codon:yes gene_type:complete